MKAQTLVVPTDFSQSSGTALEYATALARETGGKLLIIHVQEPMGAYGGGEMAGLLEPDHRHIQSELYKFRPADPNIRLDHRLLLGDPASRIVEFAKEVKADLIAIGSHGRTGVKRLLMGSVAEAVVRHAECPVLVIKEHSPARAPVS